MFVTLYGIWVERTDGMPCESNGPCARKSAYNLDDDGRARPATSTSAPSTPRS